MRNSKENLTIIILIALGLFLPFKDAGAKGFAVTPTIVEMSVGKTQVKIGTFTVVNREKYPVTVEVKLENWLKKKGYNNKISELDPGKWLTVKPDRFEIEPNSQKNVNYFVSIPEGIKGELVAMSYFIPKAKNKKSFIQTRFGVCVYAIAENKEKIKCKIIKTKVKENKETRDITFVVEVMNKGNVHIRPAVKLILKQKKKEVKRVIFYTGNAVYPGKTHTYVQTWKKADLAPGKYKARAQMTYGKVFDKTRTGKGKKVKFIRSGQDEKNN